MSMIEVRNVTKRYRADRRARFLVGRGGVRDAFRARSQRTVMALDHVSLEVGAGESLGIIGANGSGKSTLLKLIAGVTAPTEGEVSVGGRIASLLELGAGFHPMLTGRENVYLNASLLGMDRAEIDARFDAIAAFSGIGEFIDNPVDTYSSGMYVRLGFAVAVHTDADIFLVDEVLSVGDEAYQRKCRARLGELAARGKTLVFVSHDLGIVSALCDRAVLLSHGKTIARDTPRKTIDFYLRQIGPSEGVHNFSRGPLDVIVSNGRISLFYKEEEISGAGGFQCQVMGSGRWSYSVDADWTMVERHEDGCVAHGRLRGLNASWVWEVSIADGKLRWRVSLDCDKSESPDALEFNFAFAGGYARWHYEDLSGPFPAIVPEDTSWIPLTSPDLLCGRAAALPGTEPGPPTLLVDFKSERSHLRGFWMNTDYAKGSRVLRIDEPGGAHGAGLSPGLNELLTADFEFGLDTERITRLTGGEGARHAISRGPLLARFDRGCIRLSYDGFAVSKGLHVYASLLIDNLWNDSTALRWESFDRTGHALCFAGTSRRFPFGLAWSIGPSPEGIAVEVRLEALEALNVQEYHISMVLSDVYTGWETDHERGAFPAIGPEAHDWRHVNAAYEPGRRIAASGNGAPPVRLLADADRDCGRMTALNTDYHLRARVLQALHSPAHGTFHFEPGTHDLFSGTIQVGES